MKKSLMFVILAFVFICIFAVVAIGGGPASKEEAKEQASIIVDKFLTHESEKACQDFFSIRPTAESKSFYQECFQTMEANKSEAYGFFNSFFKEGEFFKQPYHKKDFVSYMMNLFYNRQAYLKFCNDFTFARTFRTGAYLVEEEIRFISFQKAFNSKKNND